MWITVTLYLIVGGLFALNIDLSHKRPIEEQAMWIPTIVFWPIFLVVLIVMGIRRGIQLAEFDAEDSK